MPNGTKQPESESMPSQGTSVRKAVIPAAGMGTRLRPVTLHTPKELLPIGQKPMIQYSIEMYIAAGISEFCIVTSPGKSPLVDFLTGRGDLPFCHDGNFRRRLVDCRVVFVTQENPLGVADAIGLARDFVGDEPFACVMPDCILFSEVSHVLQLMDVFDRHKKNVIGTIHIRGADAKRFGNVGVVQSEGIDESCFLVTSLSEKKTEPLVASRGAIIHKGFGGGIYLPEYFDLIELSRSKAKGEVDDVPIHQTLISRGRLLGVLLKGVPFDAGHPLGFRAAVHYAGRRWKAVQ